MDTTKNDHLKRLTKNAKFSDLSACVEVLRIKVFQGEWLLCPHKEKRVTHPASLSLLNPIYGAHVAPQRCTILRYGKKLLL